MEAISKNMLGKQSHYIVKIGKQYLICRCTAMEFTGTLGSDLPALHFQWHAQDLTHDLWLNDTVNFRHPLVHGGYSYCSGIIVAKYSHLWDMRKPIGERAAEQRKTSNFDQLAKYIHANKSAQYPLIK